jgi:hypothetical protein
MDCHAAYCTREDGKYIKVVTARLIIWACLCPDHRRKARLAKETESDRQLDDIWGRRPR